jgi:hypothetical protein
MLQICLSLLTPLCSNVPCQNFQVQQRRWTDLSLLLGTLIFWRRWVLLLRIRRSQKIWRVRVDADSIDSLALPLPSDSRFTRSRWPHIGSFPNSVDSSLLDPVLDSVPSRFVVAGANTELSSILRDMDASPGSSVPETTVVVPSPIATPVAPSAPDLVLGSSGLAGVGTASIDEASSTVP